MTKVFTRALKTKEVHYTTADGESKTVVIDNVPKKKVRAEVAKKEGSDNFIITYVTEVTGRYAITLDEFMKHAKLIVESNSDNLLS